jgi:hypothetical protein
MALSGIELTAWASRTVELRAWRQMGQGKVPSLAFTASWVTRHCMQKRWPHGVVAKPVGPAMGSWHRGQSSASLGGQEG